MVKESKPKKADESRTDEQAEKLATDALRRALTTPYKPQRQIIGKKQKSKGKPQA